MTRNSETPRWPCHDAEQLQQSELLHGQVNVLIRSTNTPEQCFCGRKLVPTEVQVSDIICLDAPRPKRLAGSCLSGGTEDLTGQLGMEVSPCYRVSEGFRRLDRCCLDNCPIVRPWL